MVITLTPLSPVLSQHTSLTPSDASAAAHPSEKTVGCVSTVIGVAHQDDDIVFVNPEITRALTARCPVSTVYVTAGDAGQRYHSYVRNRENGVRAAYARMAGVKNAWHESVIRVNGRDIAKMTLMNKPQVRLLFMRLPDGVATGRGTQTYGYQSLLKLFRGDIPRITPIDGEGTYRQGQLVSTVRKLLGRLTARRLLTLDHDNLSFGYGGDLRRHVDHSDHAIAARFFRKAAYGEGIPVEAYRGYTVSPLPPNLTPRDVAAKTRAAKAYIAHHRHDPHVESPPDLRPARSLPRAFANWVRRSYTRVHRAPYPGEIMSHIGGAEERHRSRHTEYCLDAKDGTARTSRCVETHTRWSMRADGTIRSRAGCLTAPGPDAPSDSVAVRPCSGEDAQRWRRQGRHLRSGASCLHQDDRARRNPRLRMGSCAPSPEAGWAWGASVSPSGRPSSPGQNGPGDNGGQDPCATPHARPSHSDTPAGRPGG